MNELIDLPIRKFVIVGSYALNHRYAKDIDVICYEADIQTIEILTGNEWIKSFTWSGRKVECLLADNQEYLKMVLDKTPESRVANLMELFIMKAGHIVYPHRQWEKHIHDYHYLKTLLAEVRPSLEQVRALIQLHRKETAKHQRARTPKLKGVTKEQFFDDNVTKYYVHDHIHYAMAHKEKPMYEYMQHDTTKVECDKALWEAFTEKEKNQCVMEEAYVIALERHIIPTMKGDRVGLNAHEAFKHSLMRICTNLCSGWFREHAVNNYFTILNSYNPNYVQVFTENIKKYETEAVA
jgi:hypothetical protein